MWYSVIISIRDSGNPVIFQGYFKVEEELVRNFYYVKNNQYVEILMTNNGDTLGQNGANDTFKNKNFSNGGINILPVIPFINDNYNNPKRLNLWCYKGNDNPPTESDNYVISFEPKIFICENPRGCEWPYSYLNFKCTFTSIPGLPVLTPPPNRFSMGSLFSNNAQVYYKPHSLSTGSGGVGNYRAKQRRT
jgi:hypothetical protein